MATFELEERDTQGIGYVYIVQSIGTNLYKIGWTETLPDRRWKELKTAMGEGLKVIAYFPGSQADESTLHDAFDRFSREGEFFELDRHAFLAVAVDCMLGCNRFPRRPSPRQGAHLEMLREHFLIGGNAPRFFEDGMRDEDLWSLFVEFCRRRDYTRPDRDTFFNDIRSISQIGRLEAPEGECFNLELQIDSPLVQKDY